MKHLIVKCIMLLFTINGLGWDLSITLGSYHLSKFRLDGTYHDYIYDNGKTHFNEINPGFIISEDNLRCGIYYNSLNRISAFVGYDILDFISISIASGYENPFYDKLDIVIISALYYNIGNLRVDFTVDTTELTHPDRTTEDEPTVILGFSYKIKKGIF